MNGFVLNKRVFLVALITASITFGIEWHVAGAVVRPFDFLLLGTFVLLIGPQILRGHIPRFPINGIVVLFFAVQTISFVNAFILTGSGRGIVNSVQTLELFIAYYLFTSTLRTSKALNDFLNYFIILLWVVAIYAAIYHFGQGNFVRFKDLDEPKLTFGILFLLTTLKLLIDARLRGAFFYIMTLCSIALMLASGERKGWAGSLVATGGLLILSMPRIFGHLSVDYTRRLVLVPIIMIVPAMLLSQLPYVQKQMNSSFTFAASIVTEVPGGETEVVTLSNEMRLFLVDRAFEMIETHPVFGVGTERFEEELLGWSGYVSHNITGVHNEYLRIAAENGIPTMIIFTIMWGMIILEAFKNWGRCFAEHGNQFAGYATLGLALYVATLVALLKGGLVPDFLTLIVVILISVQADRTKNSQSQGARFP